MAAEVDACAGIRAGGNAMALFPASGASRQSVLSRDHQERRASAHARFANLRVFAEHFAGKRTRVAPFLLTALMTGIAWAAPTDLDWRWDADGMLFPPLPAGAHDSVKQILLQADGSLIVGSSTYVARFDPFGQRDTQFGTQGGIEPPPSGYSFVAYQLAGMELRADGRIDAQWYYGRSVTPSTYECWRLWARYLWSGAPDTSFAQGGFLAPQDQGARSCSVGDQSDSAGNRFRLDRTFVPWLPVNDSWIRGLGPDGSSLPPLTPFDTARWWYWSLRIDAHDRLVIGLSTRQGTSSGFAVGRTGAGSFGTDGVAFARLPGLPSAPGVLPLARGGVLAFGSIGGVDATGARQAVIVRFTEEGRLDGTFGEGGAVVIPFARAGDPGVYDVEVAPLPDGRLLVVAEVDGKIEPQRKFIHLRMARLLPDGMPDTAFAENGIATIWTNGETLLRAGPIIRPSGEFLVASSAVVYQFRGGDLAVPYPPPQRASVEYFHAGYGHYFMTADVLEIATLDASISSGWVRTGKGFDVYGSANAQLVPVCRFWSGQSFAPKSSHFYTPYGDECAKVKQDPAWLFERNAFYVRMPEGVSGARTCPAGTQPLYRAYNNGKSGAPNHRYTTDPAVLDAMIAQGWTMEGEAATRVFACVPLQQ
jgi:uncharacterized delta-60 repeat protein